MLLRLAVVCGLVLSLTACEGITETKKDGDDGRGNYKAVTANILVTNDPSDPRYNVLNYAQTQKPHSTIDKNFRFTNADSRTFKVDEVYFDTDNCTSGGGDFGLYFGGPNDVLEQIVKSQSFEAIAEDVIQVGINNRGACENLRVRFTVVPVN